MKKLIILLSLITTTLLGQDYGNQIEAMRLCASFAGWGAILVVLRLIAD